MDPDAHPGAGTHRREIPQYEGQGVPPPARCSLVPGTQHGKRTADWISASSPFFVQCPTCTSVLSSCVGDLAELCQWSGHG